MVVLMESIAFKPPQIVTLILEAVFGKLYWKVASITELKRVRFQRIHRLYFVYHFLVSFIVDCKWSDWGQCSTTCGAGKKERQIKIREKSGGSKCKGKKIMNCNHGPCPGNLPSPTFNV